MAAQENAPSPADMPVGLVFRWLNFALVFGGLAYLIWKIRRAVLSRQGGIDCRRIREAAEDARRRRTRTEGSGSGSWPGLTWKCRT